MNRQARVKRKTGANWLDFGNVKHAEAASLYARTFEYQTATIIETRDEDHPDAIMLHRVERVVEYRVTCLRGDA